MVIRWIRPAADGFPVFVFLEWRGVDAGVVGGARVQP